MAVFSQFIRPIDCFKPQMRAPLSPETLVTERGAILVIENNIESGVMSHE